MVAYVGHADGLEQPDDLLRGEGQLLRHLVDANLAAHRASGRLLHPVPSPIAATPASAIVRKALSSAAIPAWQAAQIATDSSPSKPPSSLFALHATANPPAMAAWTSREEATLPASTATMTKMRSLPRRRAPSTAS